jgi:hypothetical protein
MPSIFEPRVRVAIARRQGVLVHEYLDPLPIRLGA